MAKGKNLVFSSVGDNTNFDTLYIGPNMEYDIYVIYYGTDTEKYNQYKSKVDWIEQRKGSKFQNFYYLYTTYPELISNYEYFFIVDDDIIINVNKINSLFTLARKYNLSICGPSFVSPSKISHQITKYIPGRLLTYTNFVEVNVPLFSRIALDLFIELFDPNLVGWGIDYFYIWCNGLNNTNTYAIIHSITCINPDDNNKPLKRRELLLHPDSVNRAAIWNAFAKSIGCPEKIEGIEYRHIML
jgi:hypothetical protein